MLYKIRHQRESQIRHRVCALLIQGPENKSNKVDKLVPCSFELLNLKNLFVDICLCFSLVRESARSLFSQVPEDAAYAHDGNPIVSVEQSSSKAGQSQALEKQTLQASQQQQPVYPSK